MFDISADLEYAVHSSWTHISQHTLYFTHGQNLFANCQYLLYPIHLISLLQLAFWAFSPLFPPPFYKFCQQLLSTFEKH